MAQYARFLWGKSKIDRAKVMEYIDFAPQDSAPTAVVGRIYMDDNYSLHKCMDGTSFATILDVVATSNPPTIAQGRIWIDSNYKIRICEDGNTFKTVTTS